jgi:hypothetical protein
MARAAFLCVATAVLLAAASPAAAARIRFAPPQDVAAMTPGGIPLELNSGDLTGDGLADVLVVRGRWASENAYPASILVNDGRGGFRVRTRALFDGRGPTAVWPRQTLLADFNGDRRRDIFIGDSGMDAPPFPGQVNYLALSRARGGFAGARDNLPPGRAYFHSAATADADADGDTDIFLGDLGSPLRLLVNDGSGRFTAVTDRFPPSVSVPGRERFTRSHFVDVNVDGAPDLVLGSEARQGNSAVLVNDRHGYFAELPDALPPKPWGENSIAIAIRPIRLNRDRFPDLIIGHTKNDPWYKGRWLQLLVNRGDGTFRDATQARFPPQFDNDADWPYEIVSGDLNRDGRTDFAVDLGAQFCCPGKRVVPPFYLNRGDGTFRKLRRTAFADEPPFGQLRLIDVNGDRRLDVFSVWQAEWDGTERYVVALQRR